MGIGDWGLGVGGFGVLGFGGWAQTPKPQSPIPNPQSPLLKKVKKINKKKLILL